MWSEISTTTPRYRWFTSLPVSLTSDFCLLPFHSMYKTQIKTFFFFAYIRLLLYVFTKFVTKRHLIF